MQTVRLLRRLKRQAVASAPGWLLAPVAVRAALLLDETELHLVDVLCDRSRGSADVGANLGVYSHRMAHHSTRVLAVEPHPTMAAFLRRSLPRNASVLEAALSDHAGHAEIHVPVQGGVEMDTRSSLEGDPTGEARAIRVDVHTLDEVVGHDCGFLKIDVEGHELSVLNGGRGLLEGDRPRVQVEVEERHHAGATGEVIRLMREFGYEGGFVIGRELHPIADFSAPRHQSPSRVRANPMRRSRTYVNNFLFVHRSESDVVLAQIRQRLARLGLARKLAALARA